MASDIFLISIYGDDKPWVTASVTEILGRYKATILDVGQADIHHTYKRGQTQKRESAHHLHHLVGKLKACGIGFSVLLIFAH